MTESPQPTSGSLSAKIIRACTYHAGSTCSLNCKYRVTEDLGKIASFGTPSPAQPSFIERLKRLYKGDSA